jgi:hypothetical protein
MRDLEVESSGRARWQIRVYTERFRLIALTSPDFVYDTTDYRSRLLGNRISEDFMPAQVLPRKAAFLLRLPFLRYDLFGHGCR